MKKEWWQSKTVWAGLVLILCGLYQAVTGQTVNTEVLFKIFGGLGFIGLRQAMGLK